MCDHTRLDKIRNEVIRGKIGVATIEDKIREAGLWWFGHIRRSMDAPVRICEKIDRPKHRRSRGRLKKSWSQVIRHDLKTLGLVEDMVQDRRLVMCVLNTRYSMIMWNNILSSNIYCYDLLLFIYCIKRFLKIFYGSIRITLFVSTNTCKGEAAHIWISPDTA